MLSKRLLLLCSLILHGSPAGAACLVTAPNLSFGPYDGVGGMPATTSGTAVVRCDESPPPTVTVQLGRSMVSAGFFPRQMQQDGGSDRLSYNFYIDPGTSAVWGDGSGGTATRSAKVTRNKPETFTIYGRIPAGQDVAAGTYSDLLTITIVF